MITLVAGGNGSGKSRYAEAQIAETQGPRVYIATMVSQNEENRQRIEKHRRQRAGLDFTTVEEPWQVSTVPVPEGAVVLLEDVSNLLANLVFSANGTREQALAEISRLADRCGQLVLVTITGLDANGYHGETAAYIRDLDWLNDRLAQMADQVIEMRDGEPVRWK